MEVRTTMWALRNGVGCPGWQSKVAQRVVSEDLLTAASSGVPDVGDEFLTRRKVNVVERGKSCVGKLVEFCAPNPAEQIQFSINLYRFCW